MLYYNSDKEIQKLKQKLMSKSNESKSDVSAASQAVNERIGKVFEKNIRYILETRHYFKKIPHVDKIFMKKIKYVSLAKISMNMKFCFRKKSK